MGLNKFNDFIDNDYDNGFDNTLLKQFIIIRLPIFFPDILESSLVKYFTVKLT